MKRIQGTAKSMGFRVRAFGLLTMIAAGQTLCAQQAATPPVATPAAAALPPGIRPASGTGHTTAEQAAANLAMHGAAVPRAMTVMPQAAVAPPAKAAVLTGNSASTSAASHTLVPATVPRP